MSKMNVKVPQPPIRTYEGAKAVRVSDATALRRCVLSTLLWEDSYYESGEAIEKRLGELAKGRPVEEVGALALEARTAFKMRHTPLRLLVSLAEREDGRAVLAHLIPAVVQRADEMGELVALYWAKGKRPLPAGMKRGLARVFGTFSAYELAKYDRKSAGVSLRDIMALVHPKPGTPEQAAVWKGVWTNTLVSPDTWEVALSSGADKTATWTRLLMERKLGALALIRNLRNMQQANVSLALIGTALREAKVDRIFPFRFVAAARYAPALEPALEDAMIRCVVGMDKLPGRTVLCVDVSGSMKERVSAKSEMLRVDVAAGLAILARELCFDVQVVRFNTVASLIPARRGFALRDAIGRADGGTNVQAAVDAALAFAPTRIIVLTDEQSASPVRALPKDVAGYMVNVSAQRPSVGYGNWNRIEGWSEAILSYITAFEELQRTPGASSLTD